MDSLQHPAHQKAKIMMVDDERLNMEVIQIFLQDAGYQEFVLVDRAPDAMRVLREEKPDILLLDLNMPEVSGIEILRDIRSDQAYLHLPVIILTSSTDAATKNTALELGATDFLAKPVDASELALRLRNTLAAKAYQDQLENYDGLTGLPNRSLFMDRAEMALKLAARRQSNFAVLNIKIGRFKEIQDTLGQGTGDTVLIELAQRLEVQIRDVDTLARAEIDEIDKHLARVSSDEFTLQLPDLRQTEDAAVVAKRVIDALEKPISAEGQDVAIIAHVGIAAYPNDGDSAESLFRNSASAASFAERTPGVSYQFYSEKFNLQSQRRLQIEAQLRRALDRSEFTLKYQPKVNVDSGRMYGVEALLRWENEELGSVSPAEFIPIAEHSGLIPAIGEWVLYEACVQQAKWKDMGYGHLNVAINISVQQFHESGLNQTIQNIIDVSGADTKHITLEVTESVLAGNAEDSIKTLRALKSMGPRLSIDDFGTGYSSLSYLKQFPIDELKIDRSFVIDVETDVRDAAIVSTVIFLAHNLGLSVVAEGIEEPGQLEFLRDKGCDVYQGFLYSRPVSPEDIEEMLSKESALGNTA